MQVFCGTKIMTPSGPLSVYNLGFNKFVDLECFKVNFNDNTSIIVPKGSGIKLVNGDFHIVKNPSKTLKLPIQTKLFDFNQDCKDPYLVGLTICCKTKNGCFLSNRLSDFDIEAMPISYYNVEFKKLALTTRIITRKEYPNIFWADMKRLKLDCRLKYRFIPENYMYSNRQQRIEIIQGLMDMNGINKKGQFGFHTCSPVLAEDFAFIIRSLGGFARVSELPKGDFFRVDIETPFCPTLSKPYKGLPTNRIKRVSSIENMGIQPCAEIPTDSLIIDNFVEVN